MKGLRVSSRAWRRPQPWPIRVSVATEYTPRSCIASKSHNIHEDPGFGRHIPVTVGTVETKVTFTRISGVYLGGIPWGGTHATRDHL